MRTYGVKVERPIVPTRMELSSNPSELLDPQAYPVKVSTESEGYIIYHRARRPEIPFALGDRSTLGRFPSRKAGGSDTREVCRRSGR